MLFSSLGKYKDFGLLVPRLGIGLIFFFVDGLPKLQGGPEKWTVLGASMSHVGITFAPEFWGFMSAFVEAAGGVVLVLGIVYRPVLVLLIINMFVASYSMIGGGLAKASYPIETLVIIVSLFILGPGKYSLDYLFFKKT